MANQYISIKEASSITGKHADTIRRLIKANKSNNKVIVRGKQGQYLIDKGWLSEQYGGVNPQSTPKAHESTHNKKDDTYTATDEKTGQSGLYGLKNEVGDVMKTLQAQLDAKDRQIEQLHQIINEKEANTTKLQDQFQQMLHAGQQLPQKSTADAAQDLTEKTPENNQADTSKKQENSERIARETKPKKQKKKGNTKPKKSTKAKAKTPAKKRWWQR